MLDRDGIVRRLAIADAHAEKEITLLKSLPKAGSSVYREHIYRYTLAKFLLEDENLPAGNRDLNELAKLSVAKASRLNPNEVTLLDVSKHCGATSSFMTKKVLLFMSLSKKFSIKYEPYNTADIESTDQLADIIYEKVSEKC